MAEAYEEIVNGESLLRPAPDRRHEIVCDRLHSLMANGVTGISTTRLLPPRSVVQVRAGTIFRPDLALVTAANGRLFLAAEVIDAKDHQIDTVIKKAIYEELNLPRLWMVDPRYDNVEIYQSGPYGLALKRILACREMLQESLLPAFTVSIQNLFRS
ncbi:MAG: Uma2 family endonuclease [Verrucomicrobia bacterium]|nr:Uma2 family endonuclease [Verrucomicrobiota bacterium]